MDYNTRCLIFNQAALYRLTESGAAFTPNTSYMCGILGIFDLKQPADSLRPQALQMSKKQRHRGPDWSGIYTSDKAILVHERLAIVDPTSGKQPLQSNDGRLILAVNGEIYNHRELRKRLISDYEFLTESDCEVIIPLYQQKGVDFLEDLNGMFAFALYNSNDDSYFIARDHMGIIPLYMGWDEWGNFYVASELKALIGVCTKLQEFPPGHYLHSSEGQVVQWYKREWTAFATVEEAATDMEAIKKALEDAVHRQLMSDVPYGVLLSGGLDSSIISAIAFDVPPGLLRITSFDTHEAQVDQNLEQILSTFFLPFIRSRINDEHPYISIV